MQTISPEAQEIIQDQQDLLKQCKEELKAAIHYDSVNDYIAERLIKRIDELEGCVNGY